jgi:uncharacterized protein (TIGR00106 family)
MSVLLEFSMFPTDKGASVSKYVSKVIAMIRDSGFSYKLTAMGTIIETETVSEALSIVARAAETLQKDSERIYSSIELDVRKGKSGRLSGKIKSIEEKIGNVST